MIEVNNSNWTDFSIIMMACSVIIVGLSQARQQLNTRPVYASCTLLVLYRLVSKSSKHRNQVKSLGLLLGSWFTFQEHYIIVTTCFAILSLYVHQHKDSIYNLKKLLQVHVIYAFVQSHLSCNYVRYYLYSDIEILKHILWSHLYLTNVCGFI